jgi:hypothetical protein
MAERGIDTSHQFPKPWTDEIVHAADVVITMGCGDACPLLPGQTLRRLDTRRPRRQTMGRSARSATRSSDASATSSTNSTRLPASEPAQRPHRITPVPALRNAQRLERVPPLPVAPC